mmetsp:Transcript_20209/g.42348  ORF Transcript_20209/g.42348 Transcript_20209/m.42348 type:complete len:271 (+) Transcript_20209:33-845(+)
MLLRSQITRVLPFALRPSIISSPLTSHLPQTLMSSRNYTNEAVGNNVEEAKRILKEADAVCFDVDSTVITSEGIDDLASYLNKGPEVSSWTARAMGGNVKFEDALAARLDIIKPSRKDIEGCLRDEPLVLTEGVESFITTLHSMGKDVWLVSGGFRIMINPLATLLNIPLSNIHANTITFNEDGSYKGFDDEELTSRDMGKPRAVESIKSSKSHKLVVMIGDGATDAQARRPGAADAFIGFGGIVDRDGVRDKADWFVYDFKTLEEEIKG